MKKYVIAAVITLFTLVGTLIVLRSDLARTYYGHLRFLVFLCGLVFLFFHYLLWAGREEAERALDDLATGFRGRGKHLERISKWKPVFQIAAISVWGLFIYYGGALARAGIATKLITVTAVIAYTLTVLNLLLVFIEKRLRRKHRSNSGLKDYRL